MSRDTNEENALSASVVIPTYQKVERLRIVLDTFRVQSLSPDRFEIVVVNDGSDDGTDALLSHVRATNPLFPLRSIRQARQGRAAARNQGIQLAKHPVLVFCDDDTIPLPHYLAAHLNEHEARQRRVVHGRIYSLPYLKFFRDPSTGELYDGLPTDRDPVFLRRFLLCGPTEEVYRQAERQKKLTLLERQIEQLLQEPNHPLKWLGFTGGNVSVERSLIDEVGGFDRQFGLHWGGEDLELGYRLAERGATFHDSTRAACYHITHHRADYKEELAASMKWFYHKHPHPSVRHLDALLLGEVRDVSDYWAQVMRADSASPGEPVAPARQARARGETPYS